jgi:ribosomal protein S18 acetylase RimI-like enzyme
MSEAPAFRIRPLTPADLDRVGALLRTVDNFLPSEVDCALELVGLAADPANRDYRVLVAEASPEAPLLGYTCFGPTPMTRSTWDLYWIATSAAARGTGVGHALHRALVEAVRRDGGRRVRVETSAKEAYGATRRFYERAAYREVGRIEHFYDDGDHLVILLHEIPA